jgi:glutamyl-tRNA synthetase
MRSDGVPLCNLGAVVDDSTMGITLVARGRDPLINTPPQILLYEALGKAPPAFAHLPMMLAPDGQKLSKRHGAVSVGEYRDKGIPASALLKYLVRFGWSFGDEEVFSVADLIAKFDWERCGKGDGKFDAKKLAAITFEHLKNPELTSFPDYAAGVRPFLEQRGIKDVDQGKLEQVIPLIRERAQSFADAADRLDYFFRDPPSYDEKAVKKFLTPESAANLAAYRELIAAIEPFSKTEIEARTNHWLTEKSISLKDVSQSVRVAVTGTSASPGLYEVLEILGKPRALERIDRAIERAKGAAGAGA